MRYLRQNTATRVSVGPFLDVTDGVTPETALTVTGCHLTLMVDDAGVPTLALDADATASAGNNDMVHVTNDDAGFYDLELTAAQTNYLGRAVLAVIDTDVHLPVFHEFSILPANVYDSLFSTDLLQVDLTQIGGVAVSTTTAQLGVNVVQLSADATAADNAEAFFDGTGYAGTNNTIPTVTTVATVTNLTNAATNGDLTATMKSSVTAAVPTAAVNAAAVWDLDATGHQTQGTFGQAIGDPVADANTIYKAVVTDATGATVGVDAAAILDDTGTSGVIVASIANNAITAAAIATGAIDADAIAADAIGASELAADAATEIGTAVWATAARTLTAATNITSTGGTTVPQTGDSYARIGANGASLTGITGVTLAATQTGVTIPTVTTLTNLPAITAGWLTATGIAADAITEAKIADAALSTEHFNAAFYTRLGILAYGTAQAATSTSLQLASALTYADDELNGAVVFIASATAGAGQSRVITDYVSSTDTATVDAWTTTPTGTITYVVFAAAPASATALPAVNLTQIAGSAVSATTAQLGVNVVQVSGDATAADNAESFFDGTGYAGTNNVIPTVTTVATTTNLTNLPAITSNWLTATGLDATAAAEIADAVWDEASTGHTDAGKAGAKVWTDIPAILADTGTDGVLISAGTGTGQLSLSSGTVTTGAISNNAITANAIATGAIDADALAADAVDEILDEVIEGTVTMRQALRAFLAALAGKVSGAGTSTITFRDTTDSTSRLVAAVDGAGNRTSVTLTLT